MFNLLAANLLSLHYIRLPKEPSRIEDMRFSCSTGEMSVTVHGVPHVSSKLLPYKIMLHCYPIRLS